MALIRFAEKPGRKNPWAEFERIRHGLDELSRNFSGQEGLFGTASVFPPINMYEDADNIIIKAELPGISAENLDISLEGETLTLKGQRPNSAEDKGKKSFHRREIESGNFSRAIALPTKIDVEKVIANMKNGILVLTLPKAAEVKPRQINISVGCTIKFSTTESRL